MVSIDLSTVERGGHAVVGWLGQLDPSDTADVTVALAGVVACHPEMIIDLAELEFIDCSGLWALTRARDQAMLAGGGLLLAAPQQLVLRVLTLTGLADVFSIHTSVLLADARRRPA